MRRFREVPADGREHLVVAVVEADPSGRHAACAFLKPDDAPWDINRVYFAGSSGGSVTGEISPVDGVASLEDQMPDFRGGEPFRLGRSSAANGAAIKRRPKVGTWDSRSHSS
jgi:hypothetical protein